MTLSTVAIPPRAANKPHAGKAERTTVVCTKQDLKRLRSQGLFSVAGKSNNEEESFLGASPAHVKTKDPQWYADRATELREELGRGQTQLWNY